MGVKELWLDDRRQGEFGLSDKKLSPTVPFSVILPWALEDAAVKKRVNQYVEENASDYVKIYYDTFKIQWKKLRIAFIIPE